MFKKLLLSLFLAVPVFSAQQSERYFNNTGGLVDRYSPILIPSNNATDIQNIQFDTRGQLLKRNGYTINSSTFSAGTATHLSTRPVTGLGYLQSTTGTSFLGVLVGSNVYTTGTTYGGSYTNVTSTVVLTTGHNNLAQFTTFKDFGVFCNESDPPIRILSNAAFRIVGASTGAKTCEGFNNYLLLGNTSEDSVTYGSRLRWSNLADIASWPANNYVDIEPDDGDSIVAIKKYQNNLYIFKKNTIYEAIITGSSGAEAFIVRPVARGVGAWAKNSVKVINGIGIVFLASDGVYAFDGSNFEFLSDSIQTRINGMNRSRYQYAVGEVYSTKHQYWLSMSYGTQTENQTTLVWDYIQKNWTVYSGITANALSRVEDSNGNVLLFSGDANGNVYKQDVGTVDQPIAVNTAISSYYVTPELTLGAPEYNKEYKYLYLFSNVTSTNTIVVDRAYNFQSGYQDSTTVSIGESGAVWGSAVWGTDVWPGISTKITRIELNRRAKSVRLKFSDSSSTDLGILGWVIVYMPGDLTID